MEILIDELSTPICNLLIIIIVVVVAVVVFDMIKFIDQFLSLIHI